MKTEMPVGCQYNFYSLENLVSDLHMIVIIVEVSVYAMCDH